MTRKLRRLVGATCCLAALGAISATVAGASVPVDLRVVSDESGNLADVRQYVPASTTVKTSVGPDCFNQAKQSSGQSYPQSTATMLGAIWEAAQVKPSLQPVRLSDADKAAFGALGVCQINAKTPPGFFFLKANHQALVVGADLFTVQGGDQLLAYRTPADFSADEELELLAPARTAPGVPVTISVRAYMNTVAPSAGATVLGGSAPVQTDNAGNASVVFPAEGIYQLIAVGAYNDIPSAALSVCVDDQFAVTCPEDRGREILGSDEGEGIKGTDGNDSIKPRDGDDAIKALGGDDEIVSRGGGRDRVNCGPGRDFVERDGSDRIEKSCETRTKKKCKKKKKARHKSAATKTAAESTAAAKKCKKKRRGARRKAA